MTDDQEDLRAEIATHPVQTQRPIHGGAQCPQIVTMRAYEHLKGERT